MHREGHYGAALLAYAPVLGVLLAVGSESLALLGGVVVVGGAMVPDLDQQIPGVSHRGITHTVWFAIAVGAVVGGIGAAMGWSRGLLPAIGIGLFGLFVGTLAVVAHLLADLLTPAGIRPFAPVRDERYTLDVARAANPIANYLLLALGAGVASVAFLAGQAVAG